MATYWANAVRFPAETRVCCLYRFQTGCGAHPITCERSPKDERLGRLLLLNMHLVPGPRRFSAIVTGLRLLMLIPNQVNLDTPPSKLHFNTRVPLYTGSPGNPDDFGPALDLFSTRCFGHCPDHQGKIGDNP